MDEAKEPSRGVKFFDTKYSPVKFLTTDDDRGYKAGDVVFVGGETKVYGPYQLDIEIGKGNGQIHWKAYSASGPRQKPLSKDELEQQNAQLLAEIEQLKGSKERYKRKAKAVGAMTTV
jgi:hypothetical protein